MGAATPRVQGKKRMPLLLCVAAQRARLFRLGAVGPLLHSLSEFTGETKAHHHLEILR